MAHEFNNLLTVISWRSQLIRDRMGSDPRLLRDAQDIEQAVQRADALMEQLLAFGQQQILYFHRLDLNRLLADLSPRVQELLGPGIAFECILDAALPPIQADSRQIQQLILDLARNARDAMPDGGRLLVETACVELDDAFLEAHPGLRRGRYARLDVRDTGPGLDDAARVRVFEPFFTTRVRGEGTGIGLAAAYGIVRQHGGHISAETVSAGGTRFRIHLPVPHAEAPAPPGGTSTSFLSADVMADERREEDHA
jgi:signal transduction histidine kinase